MDTQSRDGLNVSSSFLPASYSMRVRMITVWNRTLSIIVKKGQLPSLHVSPQLTYGQMCELPVLLHASLGCVIIVQAQIAKANCFVSSGHSQQEHETSHGSMSNVRWSVDGPDEEGLEVGGRRFSTNDEGAPMMCNLVCKALGRHVHIDYCRAEDPAECRGNNEVHHVSRKLQPEPGRPKDFLTHSLFWKRSGEAIVTLS